MAKVFAGFTPDQLGKIDPVLQGVDSDTQQQIIAANPALAARVGKLSDIAQKKVYVANGGYIKGFAEGGDIVTKAGQAAGALTTIAVKDPTQFVTETKTTDFTEEQKQAGQIAAGTGQITQPVPTAAVTTAAPYQPVAEPTKTPAATVTPETIAPAVEDTLSKVVAATGKPSADALAEAATMTPEKLSQLGLNVEQIQEAQRVQAPDARKVEAGEMISGATVDMAKVEGAVNFAAATGAPSSDATVQGQLTNLMADFEGKEPPAWAAGAMRAAAAQMATRGLGASSMAGQAMIQAAMESALPIAQMDAQVTAQFELQNLSNKQQQKMFAAQQRAEFLGLEFTQEFQTKVANATKISDIANMNFTAEQQVALENARMAQTVDLTNLNAKNAKVMADAAAMSQLDMANLNNRQQTQVQNAQAFLQMDMTNLNNEQQATMFKAQSMVNAMFSDQAAENAAKQFNATSENQVNQFFADLGARVSLSNAEQASLVERFNAGETNALAQFNSAQHEARNQFEAANSLVIAQANAQWLQSVATTENAAQNEANRQNAQRANEFTALGYNTTIQQYRDLMSYAWQTSDNDAQRAVSLAIAKLQADTAKYSSDTAAASAAASTSASKSNAMWGALGAFAGSIKW